MRQANPRFLLLLRNTDNQLSVPPKNTLSAMHNAGQRRVRRGVVDRASHRARPGGRGRVNPMQIKCFKMKKFPV
jgi:hypothetical protein